MNITRRNLTYFLASAGATLLLILGVATLPAGTASATNETNTNETTYWENKYESQFPDLVCYKHDGDKASNAHGYTTDVEPGDNDNAVVLNPFGSDWYGDKYVLLIVKAGSTGQGGVVDENNVYVNPVAGTPYVAPSGTNGQIKAVSHWIVCKGFNGEETTTTTSTIPETTTTSSTIPETTTTSSTIPETTTTSSTIPETTTTSSTIPETTTTSSTVPETTTSTVPETTTSTVPESSTTAPKSSTTAPEVGTSSQRIARAAVQPSFTG